MPNEPSTKPCVLCGRRLKPVFPEYGWENLQPCGGGEVQFIFCYGSRQFDLQAEPTVFRGVICDGCAAKHVDQMECELCPCGCTNDA